jgi:hypothetical protein
MTVRVAVCAVFAVFLTVPAFCEEVVYNDKMIRQAFEEEGGADAHRVMMRQRGRIRDIGDAFLTGDAPTISKKAGEIAAEMTEVAKTFPPASENTAEVWGAMSSIAADAGNIQKQIELKDHRKAYAHFSRLQGSCVECHQVARGWGKFEEPKVEDVPEQTTDPASKGGAPKKVKTNVLIS